MAWRYEKDTPRSAQHDLARSELVFQKHKLSRTPAVPRPATRAPPPAGRRGGGGRSSTKRTRVASSSARPTRCSESTTVAPSRSTASRKSAAPSGSSCDVGSSRSSSCGSSASADARQTRWSSPPESSIVFRPQRWSASTEASARSTRGQISAGGDAEVLEPERDLVRGDRHHDLVLRILEDGRDRAGELGRARAAGVEPGDDDPAREAAAVEVRHEPGERAQQRRLPGARRAEERDDLSRLQLERDAVQRRRRSRVGEREAADGR